MKHLPNILTGLRLALALFMFLALAVAGGAAGLGLRLTLEPPTPGDLGLLGLRRRGGY